MVEKVYSASNNGLQTLLIEIEVDITPSLPKMIVIGLPDKAVQESRERIQSALKQSGYEFPLGKITVNLAPANIQKTGTGFDLPIAISILKQIGYIKHLPVEKKCLFLGELSLDGNLRGVSGILTACLWAKSQGFEEVYVPAENYRESQIVSNLNIYPVSKLEELVDHLNGKSILKPSEKIDLKKVLDQRREIKTDNLHPNDMAYVRGQLVAKRALEIAASGGHNVMMIGHPGSGKSLLARSFATILPIMTEGEVVETTQIYSAADLLEQGSLCIDRPFRAPHHSASPISIIGGGSKLRPGEISLSHRGVLFLDEFPEFDRETLEALRQPLEDGFVQISRASGSVVYPAKFSLLAAANPTPSGFESGDNQSGVRASSQSAIARYQSKFSGPVMDRIDIHVQVNRPTTDELQRGSLSEASAIIQQRVQKARDIQTQRFENFAQVTCNADMDLRLVKEFCNLDNNTQELLNGAVDKFKLSARSYIRILKLSRTIADLAGANDILLQHVAEALQYRPKIGIV